MKKALSILLCLVLSFLFLFSCGGAARIEREEWSLVSATRYGDILYVSEAYHSEAPSAAVIDCTLKAKGGTLTLHDATNDKTYTGTYGERGAPGPTTADYKIAFGTKDGRILISAVTLAEGEKPIASLTLTVDDYVLSFIEK